MTKVYVVVRDERALEVVGVWMSELEAKAAIASSPDPYTWINVQEAEFHWPEVDY